MSNLCFAFGPDNSYLCNSPAKWTRHNLPPAVEKLFTKQPPIKDIYELVIGPSGSYYIGYLGSDNKVYCMNNGLPVHLTKWLSTNAKGFVNNDIRTTSITLGPNGSYVARDKNQMEWCGVPTDLAERLSRFGTHRTRLVSLGIDDSYVVVNTDGSGLRNLKGRFPNLEKLLAGMPNFGNVHYLSLSSYPSISATDNVDDPLFMLVMKNGGFDSLVPEGHEERFSVVTSSLPNLQTPARPPVRSPAQASSNSGSSFLKVLSGVAKAAKVANQVLNAANGGGAGYSNDNSGGGGFDTSGFQAGLQQQAWSTASDVASDPIQ